MNENECHDIKFKLIHMHEPNRIRFPPSCSHWRYAHQRQRSHGCACVHLILCCARPPTDIVGSLIHGRSLRPKQVTYSAPVSIHSHSRLCCDFSVRYVLCFCRFVFGSPSIAFAFTSSRLRLFVRRYRTADRPSAIACVSHICGNVSIASHVQHK